MSSKVFGYPIAHVSDRIIMPEAIFRRFRGANRLFLITVVIPTVLAAVYFGIFASDVYISESRFVVRSPDKQASTGLGVFIKSAGFGNAGEEMHAAQNFLVSRDALRAVNRKDAFNAVFSSSDISVFDRFNPFGTSGSFEDLYKYYQRKVVVEHDSTTSITSLLVRAYRPEDAWRLNGQLLNLAEATINRLNERGRRDLIKFALAEVEDAKDKAREAALSLSAYRNREGIIDPERQAGVQLEMVSKLQDELIATRSQLLQLRSFTPDNPQIEVLETRAKGIASSIDEELGKAAGGQRSLARAVAQYQRLALENQFAERQLASAMASLEEARNEARRKQTYVERIVEPNLPDDALEPRRLRGIFATFALGLVAWGIMTMLIAGVKEHND